MSAGFSPAVGDLVRYTDRHEKATPALVVDITDHDEPGGPYYHLRKLFGSDHPALIGDLAPVVDRPQAGQVWRCVSRPDLVLRVKGLEDGGLLAICVTGAGRPVAGVNLIDHYELIGGPEMGEESRC